MVMAETEARNLKKLKMKPDKRKQPGLNETQTHGRWIYLGLYSAIQIELLRANV